MSQPLVPLHGADVSHRLLIANALNEALKKLSYINTGAGSPEGVIAASPGAIYLRTDGGASTTLYVKESGVGTNTGWVAK